MTAWYEAEYEGDFREYKGTLLEPNNDWGKYINDSPEENGGCHHYHWGSYKCRCQQEMFVSI